MCFIELDEKDVQIAQCHSQIDTVFERLTHPDNAPATHLHARLLSSPDGGDAVLVAVGGDDLREEAARGFQVMVIPAYPGLSSLPFFGFLSRAGGLTPLSRIN